MLRVRKMWGNHLNGSHLLHSWSSAINYWNCVWIVQRMALIALRRPKASEHNQNIDGKERREKNLHPPNIIQRSFNFDLISLFDLYYEWALAFCDWPGCISTFENQIVFLIPLAPFLPRMPFLFIRPPLRFHDSIHFPPRIWVWFFTILSTFAVEYATSITIMEHDSLKSMTDSWLSSKLAQQFEKVSLKMQKFVIQCQPFLFKAETHIFFRNDSLHCRRLDFTSFE